MNNTTITTEELNALRYWAAIGQEAVELAAEALNVENQDIDPDTIIRSLVYAEADMTTEAKRLHAELDAIIEAIRDDTDIENGSALTAVNDLLTYHTTMVMGMQRDCNRLKAQLETTEASRKSWENKAVEMSVTAYLRRVQLEAAGIQAEEFNVATK